MSNDNTLGTVSLLFWGGILLTVVVSFLMTWWWLALIAVGLIALAAIAWRQRVSGKNMRQRSDLVASIPELRAELGADFGLFVSAIDAVASQETPSIALLRRKLGVNAAQAAHAMGLLEDVGIVGPRVRSRPRARLIRPSDLKELAQTLRDN